MRIAVQMGKDVCREPSRESGMVEAGREQAGWAARSSKSLSGFPNGNQAGWNRGRTALVPAAPNVL